MTWQPIATAPRDGTEFLAWCPDYEGHRIGYRHRGEWRHDPTKGRVFDPTHWQPLPPPPTTSDTAAFLATIEAAIETGATVTAEDVARLRKLADWADAPPPAGWNGTLDRHETRRAIAEARRRMRDE